MTKEETVNEIAQGFRDSINQEIVNMGLSQIGIREILGRQHNPEVLKYFSATRHSWVSTDETAWCSAFINWVAKKLKLTKSNELNARSWLTIGEAVKSPKMGDIVVFWRVKKTDWRGHVGIFIRQDEKYIYTLGGNQSNRVEISAYPKSRFLAYRRLTKLD